MDKASYIKCYEAIRILAFNGILDEDEVAVHEHNLLDKIIRDMRLEDDEE